MVRYRVHFPEPHTHYFHVEAHFPGPLPDSLTVRLPAWNPGSYLIREYARHVTNVRAEGLAVTKTGKDAWTVEGAADGVRISYRVYAYELTVRTSHLDASHAFFNGVGLFLYSDETRAEPVTLTLETPDGWKVCTGLEPTGAAGLEFAADDYDHLVDCPVEAGTHTTLVYEAAGVPHEVAIWGRGNYDADKLRTDLAEICEAGAKIFGGLPYDRYAFIVHLSDVRGGGLEHRSSSVLNYPQLGFRPDSDYQEFLELASHELFHVWNVKRILPSAFTPYDYQQENYTGLLWVMEGITDYYALLLCRLGGVSPVDRFHKQLGERMTRLARTPGRLVQSLEGSSRDTWVKLYRPDANSINSTVSYYLKGSLIAAVLDVEIRARSNDEKSLDDVMRHLVTVKTLEEGGFGTLVRDATGVNVDDLLEKYVAGTEEVDFAAHLKPGGVRVECRPADGSRDKGGRKSSRKTRDSQTRGWLGANLRVDNKGRLLVHSVPANTPARKAGLYAGDHLVAVDGWRARDERGVDKIVTAHEPGATIPVTVFRRDQLMELPVRLGAWPADTFWVVPDPDADEAARRRYEAWLGEPFPESNGAAS